MSAAQLENGQPETQTPLLSARNVSKSFFGVPVLQNVDFDLYPGEVHGLVGENGAGKSTLMKILAGVQPADDGSLTYLGGKGDFANPRAAMDAGLVTVFQEFTLLPHRTVAQNVFLGREPLKAGFIDNQQMIARTQEILDDLGVDFIDPRARGGSLSVAEQQVVEIVKALSFDAKVISMDEPTAALSDHEVELLYRIIRTLQERGVGVIYVSHRLREIFDLCDRITILKDGEQVATVAADAIDQAELVRQMVGRELTAFFPPVTEGTVIGQARLELKGCGNDYVDGISFQVHAGEIVGIAGLQGSGRTEVVEGIFGVDPFTRGQLLLDGKAAEIRSPRQAVKSGIALVTEDRKAQGLALSQSVLDNALLVVRSVFPSTRREAKAKVEGVLSSLELASAGLGQEARYLSGGNQQKVVLAKWLLASPEIVIFDEPTRGIDVGAKYAVYQAMRELAAQGKAVLMVSSELPEVIGMSDRILIMCDGELVGELPAGSMEEQILAMATGAEEESA